MNTTTNKNRESWLQEATEALRPLFLGAGYTVPPIAVSVGWPSRGATSRAKRVIGECWHGRMTEDKLPQLFISPLLDDPTEAQGVLATLVHELCHVVAGPDAKHGPQFVKVMKKVFLEGKPTSTVASETLIERFKQKIILSDAEKKKQTTRMKKVCCPDCEYVARTVQKWLDLHGPPLCPCNKLPMWVDGKMPGEDKE